VPDVGLELDAAQDDDVVLARERGVVALLVEVAVLRQDEAVDAVAEAPAAGDPAQVALDGGAGVVGAVRGVRVEVEVEVVPGRGVDRLSDGRVLPATVVGMTAAILSWSRVPVNVESRAGWRACPTNKLRNRLSACPVS
jgi:hypothetical protein